MKWSVDFKELSKFKQVEIVREAKEPEILLEAIRTSKNLETLVEASKNHITNIMMLYTILLNIDNGKKQNKFAKDIFYRLEQKGKIFTEVDYKKLSVSENSFVINFVAEHTRKPEILKALLEQTIEKSRPRNILKIINRKEYIPEKETLGRVIDTFFLKEEFYNNIIRDDIKIMLLEVAMEELHITALGYLLELEFKIPYDLQKKLITFDNYAQIRQKMAEICTNSDILNIGLEYELEHNCISVIMSILNNKNLVLEEKNEKKLGKHKESTIRSKVAEISKRANLLSEQLDYELEKKWNSHVLIEILRNPMTALSISQIIEISRTSDFLNALALRKVKSREELIQILRITDSRILTREVIKHPLFKLNLEEMQEFAKGDNREIKLYMASDKTTPKEILVLMEMDAEAHDEFLLEKIKCNPNYKLSYKEKLNIFRSGNIMLVLKKLEGGNITKSEALKAILKIIS